MNIVVITKKQWLLLLAIWLPAQLFFLYSNGIVTNREAGKYIGMASRLATGKWELQAYDYLYTGYTIILLGLKLLGLSFKWMYLVQVSVAAISLVCFVRVLQTVLSSSTAILLTAALYAVCPLIQPWNCFLYTDALFMHLMLISLFLLVYPFKKPPLKTSVALLLVLPFFRPVGFLCILLAMAVWIIKGSKKHAAYIISFSGYFLLITIFLRYCLTHPSDFFYPNHNSEANIICGYPSSLEAYIRSPYQPGESMFHFFVSNPSMTWRLFTNRLFKAFWMTRPYFSQKHNFYLSIFLIVHYSIAVLGIFVFFFRKLYKKEGYLFIGLLLFSLPIIVFCADWVNRFILPALVFVYFFIGLGVDLLFQQYAGFKVRPESAI